MRRYLDPNRLRERDGSPDLGIPLWFKVFCGAAITVSLSVVVVFLWGIVELVRWVTR